MISYKKLDRHAELVGQMARARDVDLTEAMLQGKLTEEAYRSAVIRCTHCESPEACAEWLRDHPDSATTTPEYCRNGHLFRRIKAL